MHYAIRSRFCGFSCLVEQAQCPGSCKGELLHYPHFPIQHINGSIALVALEKHLTLPMERLVAQKVKRFVKNSGYLLMSSITIMRCALTRSYTMVTMEAPQSFRVRIWRK